MKLSPKFILAFVLLMLSFSMGGNAMKAQSETLGDCVKILIFAS